MATKPTKQQIAQGKARAGGNNPVKVKKAGVKRLGQAALIAGSLLPAGRAVKVGVTVAKAARASSPVSKRVVANQIDRAEQMLKLNKDIKTKEDAAVWATHPGAASFKSNQRLVKEGKWSSPKQIARYQRAEAKEEIKGNARGLKAANKPVSKNNRNVGGPKLTAILKRSEPARPNRTRLGNTTKKK
jgi:hypothetical protein